MQDLDVLDADMAWNRVCSGQFMYKSMFCLYTVESSRYVEISWTSALVVTARGRPLPCELACSMALAPPVRTDLDQAMALMASSKATNVAPLANGDLVVSAGLIPGPNLPAPLAFVRSR